MTILLLLLLNPALDADLKAIQLQQHQRGEVLLLNWKEAAGVLRT